MRAPPQIARDLKGIRSTFEARWNPTAYKKRTEYNADGFPRDPGYEGRWEIWDTDAEGREYRVMTVREPDGGFRPLDGRTTLWLKKINPARFGGRVDRLLKDLVEDPNRRLEEMDDANFKELAHAFGKWGADLLASRVGPATHNR